jgi:DNA-binding transcriptional ArsR family regulator
VLPRTVEHKRWRRPVGLDTLALLDDNEIRYVSKLTVRIQEGQAMSAPIYYDILPMLKALAEDSRLALLRYLHEREHAVGDLAERLGLSEPTVSHHLARLREAGLVSLRMAGNQRFYRVNEAGLARFKRLAAEIEQAPPAPGPKPSDDAWIVALGWSEADQQVLREHTQDGVLVRLPVRQQKKLEVILRWLATRFEPEKLYTEAQVNAVLKAVYAEDHVSLRRDLVDFGYLRRDRAGGKYMLMA